MVSIYSHFYTKHTIFRNFSFNLVLFCHMIKDEKFHFLFLAIHFKYYLGVFHVMIFDCSIPSH